MVFKKEKKFSFSLWNTEYIFQSLDLYKQDNLRGKISLMSEVIVCDEGSPVDLILRGHRLGTTDVLLWKTFCPVQSFNPVGTRGGSNSSTQIKMAVKQVRSLRSPPVALWHLPNGCLPLWVFFSWMWTQLPVKWLSVTHISKCVCERFVQISEAKHLVVINRTRCRRSHSFCSESQRNRKNWGFLVKEGVMFLI